MSETPTVDDVFSRMLRLREIGPDGQAALLRAHVAVIGAGAVGAGISELLVRAGVGRLTVIDRDYVDFSNLTRQNLYTWHDAENAFPKAEAARRHLNDIMPSCQVFPKIVDLNPDNIHFMLKGVHLVCDGTDNLETRYLINDWCIIEGVPWIYAGSVGVEASTFPVIGKNGCLRCIFPDAPPPGTLPTCDTAGVLGTATSLAASQASTLAIRLLVGETVKPEFRTWNIWTGTSSSMSVNKIRESHGSGDCPLCADGRTDYLDSDATDESRAICGRDQVQVHTGHKIDLGALAKTLGANFETENNGFMVRFAVDGYTLNVFEDGRVMVSGTRDLSRARSVIDKYIGT